MQKGGTGMKKAIAKKVYCMLLVAVLAMAVPVVTLGETCCDPEYEVALPRGPLPPMPCEFC